MKKTITLSSAAAILLVVGGASADPTGPGFRGSDTLEGFTNELIALCNGSRGTRTELGGGAFQGFSWDLLSPVPINYIAEGSSNGENAMVNLEQQIAPMSRFLDDSGCDTPTGGDFAAGLVVANDAVVVVSSERAAEPADGNDSGSDVAGSSLKFASQTINFGGSGPYTFQSPVDILRIIFGGLPDRSGPNASLPVTQIEGCNSLLRNFLQSNYMRMVNTLNMQETGSAAQCGGSWRAGPNGRFLYGNSASGPAAQVPAQGMVKFPTATSNFGGTLTSINPPSNVGNPFQMQESLKLYRRADFSGTTDTFIGFLGLDDIEYNDDDTVSLSTGFCNGTEWQSLDPIQTPCTPEMDVCENDGDSGWLQPILVIGERAANPAQGVRGLTADDIYPRELCDPGRFAPAQNPLEPVNNIQLNGCPDNGLEFLGTCQTPQNAAGGFDCLNLASNISLFGSGDGRAFNLIVRYPDGAIIRDSNGNQMFNAWYRASSRDETQVPSSPLPPSEPDCTQDDSTRQIGCLAGLQECSAGFAGNEAAFQANAIGHAIGGIDPTAQTAALPDGDPGRFPLSRKLYYNTLVGFNDLDTSNQTGFRENALAQCIIRGVSVGGRRAMSRAAEAAGFFPLVNPATNAEVGAECREFNAIDAEGECSPALLGCNNVVPL